MVSVTKELYALLILTEIFLVILQAVKQKHSRSKLIRTSNPTAIGATGEDESGVHNIFNAYILFLKTADRDGCSLHSYLTYASGGRMRGFKNTSEPDKGGFDACNA